MISGNAIRAQQDLQAGEDAAQDSAEKLANIYFSYAVRIPGVCSTHLQTVIQRNNTVQQCV